MMPVISFNNFCTAMHRILPQREMFYLFSDVVRMLR